MAIFLDWPPFPWNLNWKYNFSWAGEYHLAILPEIFDSELKVPSGEYQEKRDYRQNLINPVGLERL